jgi:uncharacterized phage infection (PIP) family protein YhgE
MDKIELLESKFKSAFNEDQSEILADVIYHSYEDLVKISDFIELKEIVQDLGGSQKRTETRVEDLADSLKRTDKKVDELADSLKQTDKKVDDLADSLKRSDEKVEELAESLKKTDKKVDDLADSLKRTDEKVEELAESLKKTDKKVDDLADSLKRTDKKVDELADAQKQTDKKVDKLEKSVQNLARQVGGLSESFGGSLEDFALDIVPEVLENNWNMSIDLAYREDFVLRNKTVEIDLIIEGRLQDKPIVVLCEVKSNLTLEEAKKFFLLVELIKDKFEAEIRVLFFGYRVKRDALEFIKDMGGFAISTRGLLL